MRRFIKNIPSPGAFFILLTVLCSCGLPEQDVSGSGNTQNLTSFSYSHGNLEAKLTVGEAPENVADFLDLKLEITTAGTEPEILFPDF